MARPTLTMQLAEHEVSFIEALKTHGIIALPGRGISADDRAAIRATFGSGSYLTTWDPDRKEIIVALIDRLSDRAWRPRDGSDSS